jgi:Uma2 family endonuclease
MSTVPFPKSSELINSARMLLEPISWQTYDHLRKDLNDHSACRLTYDQGRLEIMPPLPVHEERSSLLDHFIMILSEELNLKTRPFGSTTLYRQALQRGLEPDKCYYIQHEYFARGKTEFDLNQMPPPDLVVEVDMTSSSIKKLPIYLALGVPEVWRYEGKKLSIYQLRESEYVVCETSSTFANLPLPKVIPEFIQHSATTIYIDVLRDFRRWVREQIAH